MSNDQQQPGQPGQFQQPMMPGQPAPYTQQPYPQPAQFGFQQPPQPAGWGQQPGAPPTAPTGISVPIKLESGGQSIRLYLHFAGDFSNPTAINQLLAALGQAGFPLDSFQQRGGGWGGNNGGGGYGGNRGGGYGGYGGGRRW